MPVARASRAPRARPGTGRRWSPSARSSSSSASKPCADHAAVAQQQRRRLGDGGAQHGCGRLVLAEFGQQRGEARAVGDPPATRRIAGSSAMPSRRVDRSRGRAERSATRARMRSRSPSWRSCSRSGSIARSARSGPRSPGGARAARACARSGRCSQRRSRRPPIGVMLRSSTPSRVCSRASRGMAVELEVAARGRIHRHAVVAVLDRDAADVRQRRALRVLARTAAARRRPTPPAAGLRNRSRAGRGCRRTRSACGWRCRRRNATAAGGAAPAARPPRRASCWPPRPADSAGDSRASSAASAASPATSCTREAPGREVEPGQADARRRRAPAPAAGCRGDPPAAPRR